MRILLAGVEHGTPVQVIGISRNSDHSKIKILRSYTMLPTLLWRSETRPIMEKYLNEMKAFHQNVIRRILKINWKHHVSSEFRNCTRVSSCMLN